jgi:hypothetical protein
MRERERERERGREGGREGGRERDMIMQHLFKYILFCLLRP